MPDGGWSLPTTPLATLSRVRCDGRLPAFPSQRAGGDTHLLTLREILALGVPENLETKVHGTGAPHDDAAFLTRAVGHAVTPGAPVTLQSFDWRSLEVANREFPWLQTVALMGEGQTDADRAGLPWPQVDAGTTVLKSGGFENLAITPDGATLYAMLEKPLSGRELLAFSFDLATKSFTGVAFRFPLDDRAKAVGDITMIDATHGYALERDDSEGKPDGYKRLVAFTLPAQRGGLVTRRTALDLLAIPTADGGTFSFPFWTTEGVVVTKQGVAIINDNNFPFGRGRSATEPDPTELILVH
jgi:hypothetical protein